LNTCWPRQPAQFRENSPGEVKAHLHPAEPMVGGVWGEKPNSNSLGTPLEVGGFKHFLRPVANRPVRPSAHGSPLIFAVQPPQRWSQPASQKWILGSLVIPKSYQNPAELGGLSWPESESARNFVDENVYEKFSEKSAQNERAKMGRGIKNKKNENRKRIFFKLVGWICLRRFFPKQCLHLGVLTCTQ